MASEGWLIYIGEDKSSRIKQVYYWRFFTKPGGHYNDLQITPTEIIYKSYLKCHAWQLGLWLEKPLTNRKDIQNEEHLS